MSKKAELLKLQKELLHIKERVLPNDEADMIEKIQSMPSDELIEFLARSDVEEYGVTHEYAIRRIKDCSLPAPIPDIKNSAACIEFWRKRGILLYGIDKVPEQK
ncbi:hypothetical protein [Lutispora sp.]|uniref:hypothetical protein n=1 Tax=Lutispora sp. TaxID=2828727 RepID=UPI00356A2B8D